MKSKNYLVKKNIFLSETNKAHKRLIQIGSSENDIILDFFSGSATTAHATLQLNAEVNKILRDKIHCCHLKMKIIIEYNAVYIFKMDA